MMSVDYKLARLTLATSTGSFAALLDPSAWHYHA